jgi:type IV pilus assembly protein PilM
VFGRSGGFVTGLDVGTESVKAVRLRHHADRAQLVGVALANIEYPSAIRSDTDPDANAARVTAIRSALEAAGTVVSPSSQVMTAVEGPSVSVKHVTFPKMPGPSLAESIGWEAKKHVPFGASEFVLDFQLLPRASRDPENEMHVLLAAVEQRLIDRHVGLLLEAGIEPSAVDVAPLALMNELGEEKLLNEGAAAAVEIGAGTLSVCIYRNGGLLLARSVRMPARPAGMTEELEGGRPKWLEFALKEVQRSLAFYNTETGRQGIEKIYLSGGRALTDGIVDRFMETLDTPTHVLNPLERVGETGVDMKELKSQGPRFALAMSLARRR